MVLNPKSTLRIQQQDYDYLFTYDALYLLSHKRNQVSLKNKTNKQK